MAIQEYSTGFYQSLLEYAKNNVDTSIIPNVFIVMYDNFSSAVFDNYEQLKLGILLLNGAGRDVKEIYGYARRLENL